MIFLRLFWEFFKVGLFSVGGGLATIPFLTELAQRTGWFTVSDLADMVAVAESTPGPIGVNVATYVGYSVASVLGAVVSSLGLIMPSFIIITVISFFLEKFRNSRGVDAAFKGIRPASVALITAALVSLAMLTFVSGGKPAFPAIVLALLLFALTNFIPKIKELHPIVWILIASVVGIMLKL